MCRSLSGITPPTTDLKQPYIKKLGLSTAPDSGRRLVLTTDFDRDSLYLDSLRGDGMAIPIEEILRRRRKVQPGRSARQAQRAIKLKADKFGVSYEEVRQRGRNVQLLHQAR